MRSNGKKPRQPGANDEAAGVRLINSPLLKWAEDLADGKPLTNPKDIEWFDESGWAYFEDIDRVATPEDNPLVDFTERLYRSLANVDGLLRDGREIPPKRRWGDVFSVQLASAAGRSFLKRLVRDVRADPAVAGKVIEVASEALRFGNLRKDASDGIAFPLVNEAKKDRARRKKTAREQTKSVNVNRAKADIERWAPTIGETKARLLAAKNQGVSEATIERRLKPGSRTSQPKKK